MQPLSRLCIITLAIAFLCCIYTAAKTTAEKLKKQPLHFEGSMVFQENHPMVLTCSDTTNENRTLVLTIDGKKVARREGNEVSYEMPSVPFFYNEKEVVCSAEGTSHSEPHLITVLFSPRLYNCIDSKEPCLFKVDSSGYVEVGMLANPQPHFSEFKFNGRDLNNLLFSFSPLHEKRDDYYSYWVLPMAMKDNALPEGSKQFSFNARNECGNSTLRFSIAQEKEDSSTSTTGIVLGLLGFLALLLIIGFVIWKTRQESCRANSSGISFVRYQWYYVLSDLFLGPTRSTYEVPEPEETDADV